MPTYKAKAIVLKSYKLGEADKIIKMYSSEHGIISAVAKGSRKTKSRFGGRLELNNIIDLELYEGKTLDVITQAEALKSFKNIPRDFYKYTFSELIGEIVLKTQGSEKSELTDILFKLIYITLNNIDGCAEEDIKTLKLIASFFIARFLRITGYFPRIDNCAICNESTSLKQEKKTIYFSTRYGGIVCGNCRSKLDSLNKLNKVSFRLLKDLLNAKIEDLVGIEVDSLALKKVYKILENYLIYHTDSKIKCFDYIRKIS